MSTPGDDETPRRVEGEELDALLEESGFREFLDRANAAMTQVTREFDEGGFEAHVSSDDPLGALLRAHLWCEAELIGMVRDRLPADGDMLYDGTKWDHRHWLELAVGLGALPADWAPAYRHLNKLRNRVAHNLGKDLTAEDVRVLISKVPGGFDEVTRHSPDESFQARLRTVLTVLVMTLKAARAGIGYPGFPGWINDIQSD